MRGKRHLWIALGILATLLALAGTGGAWWYHTTRPEYRLRQGQEALRRGDLQRAEQFSLWLEAAGALDQAHLLRGEMVYRQDRPAEALYEFNQVKAEGDLQLQAVALSAPCLLRLKNLSQAEAAWRFVLDRQPDNADAHRGLAVIYYDLGALAQSVAHLKEVARLDPGDARPHRQMGIIYNDLDQRQAAVAAYQESLSRELADQEADEVRQELADCLVKQSRHAEALDVLAALSPEAAASARATALRAESLWRQESQGSAQALLDKALAQYPRAAELLRLRGWLALEADAAGGAAGFLERALAVDPHDFATRFRLAQAYERLGRSTEAARERRRGQQTQSYFDELTRLNREAMERPWDAEVRHRLARVCDQLGKPDLAAMWREAAAACPPRKE